MLKQNYHRQIQLFSMDKKDRVVRKLVWLRNGRKEGSKLKRKKFLSNKNSFNKNKYHKNYIKELIILVFRKEINWKLSQELSDLLELICLILLTWKVKLLDLRKINNILNLSLKRLKTLCLPQNKNQGCVNQENQLLN